MPRHLARLSLLACLVTGVVWTSGTLAAPASTTPNADAAVTVTGRTATAKSGYTIQTVSATRANVSNGHSLGYEVLDCSCSSGEDEGCTLTISSRDKTATCGGKSCCGLTVTDSVATPAK